VFAALQTGARAAPLPAAGWDFPASGRTVSFADVHGAWDELATLLRETGTIDAEGNWSGGSARLVSTGDLLDRGPDSRKVLDLLMRLQEQAPRAGGAVHVVLGNHEQMVAAGDMRYVSAAEYAAFAAEETAAEREALFASWRALHPDQGDAAQRAAFDKAYPPGYAAMRRAFGPDGDYGRWLLAQPLMLKIGDTLYMHGGISRALVDMSLDEANRKLRADLLEYLALVDDLGRQGVLPPALESHLRVAWLQRAREAFDAANGKGAKPPWAAAAERLAALDASPVFDPYGPLWYRGNALCHPVVTGYDVERVLAAWKARRVVLGHTPTPTLRVTERLDGQVILADTGMLRSVYKGRASAVIIEGDALSVRYAGEPRAVAPVAGSVKVPRQPPGMDDAALEAFLRTAPIVASREVGTGITKPLRLTLEKDGVKLDAVYKNVDTDPELARRKAFRQSSRDENDRYVYDVAAYKLDRLLGLNRVPVAVVRSVDGKPGLVQLWVTGTINERDRAAQGGAWEGACAQRDEYRLRIVFDLLIYNEDRNLTNLLWSEDDYTLLLIDHSRAFRPSGKRAPQYTKTLIELPELFRARLAALDRATLASLLGEYLHPKQIDAILGRRDMILREAKPTGFRL
jgi:hypothetical protein